MVKMQLLQDHHLNAVKCGFETKIVDDFPFENSCNVYSILS